MSECEDFEFDRDDFLSWLNEHIADEVGHTALAFCCPLTTWIKTGLPPGAYVRVFNSAVCITQPGQSEHRVSLPDWMNDFIINLDTSLEHYAAVSGQQAKDILQNGGKHV